METTFRTVCKLIHRPAIKSYTPCSHWHDASLSRCYMTHARTALPTYRALYTYKTPACQQGYVDTVYYVLSEEFPQHAHRPGNSNMCQTNVPSYIPCGGGTTGFLAQKGRQTSQQRFGYNCAAQLQSYARSRAAAKLYGRINRKFRQATSSDSKPRRWADAR
jgi:hypothetical protein